MAANGIKNAINESIEKQNIETCKVAGVAFHSVIGQNELFFDGNLDIAARLINVNLSEKTKGINWIVKTEKTYEVGENGNREIVVGELFVITNGINTIKYGICSLGDMAFEISGNNCEKLLEPLINMLHDNRYIQIQQKVYDFLPFHKSEWLENAKNILLENLNKQKLEYEIASQAIEVSIKILTFLLGRKKELSEEEKEFIQTVIEEFYSEELEIIDIDIIKKIEKNYQKVSHLQNSKDFFSNNRINQIAEDLKYLLFKMSLIAVILLWIKSEEEKDEDEAKIRPEYIYNLYLIRKNLRLSSDNEEEILEKIAENYQLSQEKMDLIKRMLLSEEVISLIKERSPEIFDSETAIDKTANQIAKKEEKTTLDFKSQLEFKFKKISNQLGDKSNLVYLAYNSPEKLALVAKGYAKNATTDEKPLLIYNNSLSENCKSGFLLTDKHVYAKNSFSFSNICLNVSDLNEISPKLGFLSSSISFNSKEIETGQIGQDGTELLCEFLNFCLKNLKSAKDIKISTFEEIFQ